MKKGMQTDCRYLPLGGKKVERKKELVMSWVLSK
jgi:hypothetical protein